MADKTFSKLSDDVVLKILFLLEDDPRSWARLSCVSKKLSSLVSTVCCKSKCISTLPSLSADLLSLSTASSADHGGGGWSSLYKIAVCCPGLLHSGVLLDHSDFGLLRELGPDEDYHYNNDNNNNNNNVKKPDPRVDEGQGSGESDTWTMYDDLYFDTVYDNSESASAAAVGTAPDAASELASATTTPANFSQSTGVVAAVESADELLMSNGQDNSSAAGEDESGAKRRRKAGQTTTLRVVRSHLASGGWSLSREEGNKLLASRFRDDCLYISDWPGCVHMEEKRNYMVFRGVFRNFKRSRVWRTINDGQRSKAGLNCGFCGCKNTWDLHSAFCLKRGFGFHDDGEPVVRAYVCENGHVSGAWTDFPFYTS